MLKIRAALFYYKLGQTLLQIGAAITTWGCRYYKIGQLLQIRAIITNWGITNANFHCNLRSFFKMPGKKMLSWKKVVTN